MFISKKNARYKISRPCFIPKNLLTNFPQNIKSTLTNNLDTPQIKDPWRCSCGLQSRSRFLALAMFRGHLNLASSQASMSILMNSSKLSCLPGLVASSDMWFIRVWAQRYWRTMLMWTSCAFITAARSSPRAVLMRSVNSEQALHLRSRWAPNHTWKSQN